MTTYNRPSRCSGSEPLTFRWYGYPRCVVGEDLKTAVDRLMAAVSGERRLWNPYAAGMTRSEFKKRIQKAQRGELEPVSEIKPVDVKSPPPLYEIRWIDIAVTERSEDGGVSHTTAQVRMYHSEPLVTPSCFVGHHVHEKLLHVDEVNAEQQLDIAAAVRWYEQGEETSWGIA